MLTLILKATVVLAGACAIGAAMRRGPASARHLVWVAAMAGVLLLPLLSRVVPKTRLAELPAASFVSPAQPAPSDAPHPAPSKSRAPLRVPWTAIWMAGTTVVLARVGAGLARVWWWSRKGSPMSLNVSVQVRESQAIRLPMTWGVVRPVILLPAEARAWSDARIRQVLAHELSHIERNDWLTQMIGHLTCALYWFHPLAWYAAAEARKEAELACDDAVLRAGTAPAEYGATLVDLAKGLNAREGRWSAAVGMAEPTRLEGRLRAMLEGGRDRRGVSRGRAAVTALASLCLLAPLAALRSPAQTAAMGRLAGVVRDPSGGTIPGAVAGVISGQPRVHEIVQTNDAGEFVLPALPAGTYEVQVSKRGFRRLERRDVAVTVGATALDLTLDIGGVFETVDVIGKAPRQPVSAGTPRRIRVGGEVQATKLVYQTKPEYPARAQEKGVEGTVLLNAVISRDGSLIGLTALNRLVDPDLTAAAMDAARQWRYQPTLLNGEPVEVVTTITVNFRLVP
ncbi:MAG: M56 family metallopeptidase [Bryobacteraceae bacterium]